MNFHAGSITSDMREYHSFREIDPSTVAAIIETGFLNLDREILTKRTDLIAEGVDPSILAIDSHGEDNPLISTGDGVSEPRNRRVEVTVR